MAELSGDIQKKDSRPDTQYETNFKWRSCLAREIENNTMARHEIQNTNSKMAELSGKRESGTKKYTTARHSIKTIKMAELWTRCEKRISTQQLENDRRKESGSRHHVIIRY